MTKKITYTDEQLLENLRLVAENIGHTPTYPEYHKHPNSLCSENIYRQRFGTWIKALQKAKLKPSRMSTKRIVTNKTKKQIIKDLQKAANQLGHTPTRAEFKNMKWIKYSIWYVISTFGTYNKAIIAAGLKPRMRGDTLYCKKIKEESKQQFLHTLYETALSHPNLHSIGSIIALTQYDNTTVYSYFKSTEELQRELYIKYGIKIVKKIPLSMQLNVYIDAITRYYNIYKKIPGYYELEQFSGLCLHNICYTAHIEKSGLNKKIKMSYTELVNKAIKKMVIVDLQKKYTLYKNTENLTYQKFIREICGYSKNKLIQYFGSVISALKAAKIPLRPPKINGTIYSDKKIIQAIQRVAKNLGHIPSSIEYKKHFLKTATIQTIINHFGSWSDALKAAGLE